jgi:diguanylate cyclase (GGDEF)-like protein/PAS domain S-box-containing protein
MHLIDAFKTSLSPVGLMNAANGMFLGINPAFTHRFGYAVEQIVGFTPLQIGLWHDYEFRAKAWALLRNEQRIVDLPTPIKCFDGTVEHHLVNAEYVECDGNLCVLFLLHPAPLESLSDSDGISDAFYRSLYLAASEGLYRALPKGGFIDANPAIAKIFGFNSPHEFLLEYAHSMKAMYVEPERVDEIYSDLNKTGRANNVRLQVYKKDGSKIWINENVRNIFNDNGHLIFQEGSITDITQQVEAEEAIRQSQALYQVLLEHSRDGVYLMQNGLIKFANQALAEALGYTLDELVGMPYMHFVVDEDVQAQESRRRQRESGYRGLQMYEILLQRKDGTKRLFEVRAAGVDYQGAIASTGTMRDITDERRYVDALKLAERRYRELFENTPSGLFESALDGSVISVNPMMAKMLKYETVDLLKQHVKNTVDVYADPKEREILVNLAKTQGGFNEYVTQLVDKNGDRRWISASVRLIRNEKGEPSSFAGSLLDVDERHRMQEALASSESKYRTLIEHSQVGVFILKDLTLTYCNQTLLNLTGYSEQEILGKSILEFIAPENIEDTVARFNRLHMGEEIEREYDLGLIRKDGQRMFIHTSIGEVMLDGVPHRTGTMLDITKQREAERKLRFHATHDALTGLPNRMYFTMQLADRIRSAMASENYDYAILFLDLDGFKWVNDSLGHNAGDRLLIEISRRLENQLRGLCTIARYGGDEFTLLPVSACDEAQASQLARVVLRVFEQPFDVGGQQVFSKASIGVVVGRHEYQTPDQLIRDADTAMYRAKAAGKSAFVIFDEQMHQKAKQRFELENDFRSAFERDEFILHFQPIVHLRTGEVLGAEALVRWQHPTRGLLLPGEFLSIAEETGLIADMDAWVMRQAASYLSQWRKQFPKHHELFVNVNVDEKQLASPDIIEEVRLVLEHFGLPPSTLRLEVTEIVFRAGHGISQERLLNLKQLGVGLVVDDFGTGYSSLESFAASAFDALKIDQVFVRDLASNHRHRAIVKTIIGFAKDLGLNLTAEGIETAAQRELLREMGCEVGQGYFYDRPLVPREFEQRLYKMFPDSAR